MITGGPVRVYPGQTGFTNPDPSGAIGRQVLYSTEFQEICSCRRQSFCDGVSPFLFQHGIFIISLKRRRCMLSALAEGILSYGPGCMRMYRSLAAHRGLSRPQYISSRNASTLMEIWDGRKSKCRYFLPLESTVSTPLCLMLGTYS